MVIRIYLDEIKKYDLNLLCNIPKSLKILENFRLNNIVNLEDIKLIESTIFDAYKSLSIDKNKKLFAKKSINFLIKYIQDDNFRTPQNKILIRKRTYQLENILKTYRIFIRKKSHEISNKENDFYYYLPNQWKSDIDEFSKKIYQDIVKIQELRMDEKEKQIFYKIQDIYKGTNISQLARYLKIDYNYLWKLIEKFDRLNFVETIGGHRENKRDRIVFPSLDTPEYRKMRNGKEGIITGLLQRNINSYLDWSKLRGKFVSVYEFNSTMNKPIYVITHHCNLENYRNLTIRSLGLFYQGDLDRHLQEHYQIKFVDKAEEFADQDSLIAYLHQIEGIKETWYDETSQRGKNFSNKIGGFTQ
jgi:hypothetical protein